MNQTPPDDADGPPSSHAEPTFACIRCWKLKKKCDKGSPHCKRCITAGLACVYSDEPPTGRLVKRASQRNAQDAAQRNTPSGSVAAPSSQSPNCVSTELSFDFTTVDNLPLSPQSDSANEGPCSDRNAVSRLTSPIFAPYHSIKHELPAIFQTFLLTLNTWFPIVSETQFSNLAIHDGITPDAESCTLFLAIYLLTKLPADGRSLANLYTGLKRYHSNLQTVSTQPIPIIQAGMLLAMYEQGQSLHQLSYLTIGAAVRLAQAIGMHRTLEIDLELAGPERAVLEHQRHLWWVLVIVERALAFYDFEEMRPFASASPKITDFLPSFWSITGESDGGIGLGHAENPYTQFPDINLPFTNPLGESVQAAFLLAKVYEHMVQPRLSSEQRNLEVEYLDQLLQMYLIRALGDKRKQDGSKWHHSCGAFFLCMCTRLRLHMHNLKHTRHRHDHISKNSTQRSLIAIHMIARMGTDSKQTAQHLGELDDEFLKETNMPSFTLAASRDVILMAFDILRTGLINQEGAGDEKFWRDAIVFYRASFEVLKRKWTLAADFIELAEKESRL